MLLTDLKCFQITLKAKILLNPQQQTDLVPVIVHVGHDESTGARQPLSPEPSHPLYEGGRWLHHSAGFGT